MTWKFGGGADHGGVAGSSGRDRVRYRGARRAETFILHPTNPMKEPMFKGGFVVLRLRVVSSLLVNVAGTIDLCTVILTGWTPSDCPPPTSMSSMDGFGWGADLPERPSPASSIRFTPLRAPVRFGIGVPETEGRYRQVVAASGFRYAARLQAQSRTGNRQKWGNVPQCA